MTLQLWWLPTFVIIVTSCWIKQVFSCIQEPALLTAHSDPQGLVFPDMELLETGAPQRCAWIISSDDSNDVISFQLTDWFGPASYSCSRDYLSIRDGSSSLSPSLRVVCGYKHFTGAITSTSESVYVQFHVFSDDGQSGFALEFWTVKRNAVAIQAPVYGPINYILISMTLAISVSFLAGLICLVYREKEREAKAAEELMKERLQHRRQGISGISGIEESYAEHTDDTSRTDVTSFVESSPQLSNLWKV